MALGDVYQLVAGQTLLGQRCENVYFYLENDIFATTLPTRAQVLVEGWIDQILDDIRGCQSVDVLYTDITATCLFDPTNAFSQSVSLPGTVTSGPTTGSTTSPFDAFAFQLEGDNPAIRKGAKRIAGVDEGFVDDGIIPAVALSTGKLQDAADAMARAVEVGTIITDPVFFPCVVKRVREGVEPAFTYRLPENAGETTLAQVGLAVFKLAVSSQVSRKFGVGI